MKTATCRFALEDYSTAYPELEKALSLSREVLHTAADHCQVAEILNNLGCLTYMGGEIERSMLFFRESLKVLTTSSELSMYYESKFSYHTASLNWSITRANIGFLSLTFFHDAAESVVIFESALKVSLQQSTRCRYACFAFFLTFGGFHLCTQDQQLLLRDAHVTLVTTMEHLAVANLLAGSKDKALQVRTLVCYDRQGSEKSHHLQVADTLPRTVLLLVCVCVCSCCGGSLACNSRRWGPKTGCVK